MGGFEAFWPWCISQWQPEAEDQLNKRERRSWEILHCGWHWLLKETKILIVTEENIKYFWKCIKNMSRWQTLIKLKKWLKMKFFPVLTIYTHRKATYQSNTSNWSKNINVGARCVSVRCFCPLVAACCISLMWAKRLSIIYIGSYTPTACITVYDKSLYSNKIHLFTKEILLKVFFFNSSKHLANI